MQKRLLGSHLIEVMVRLQKTYGTKRRIRRANLVEQILLGLLSAGISTDSAVRTVQRILSEFVDWNEFRVSAPRDVCQLLAPTKITEQGARLAENFLFALFEKASALTLESIERSKPTEAYEWLTNLRGSPSQAAAEAVLAWFGAPFFPVDADLCRVLKRISILQSNENEDSARRLLQRLIPKNRWYGAYHLFADHAVLHCTPEDFDCATCPVLRLCQTGQQKTSQAAKAARIEAKPTEAAAASAHLSLVSTGVRTTASAKDESSVSGCRDAAVRPAGRSGGHRVSGPCRRSRSPSVENERLRSNKNSMKA